MLKGRDTTYGLALTVALFLRLGVGMVPAAEAGSFYTAPHTAPWTPLPHTAPWTPLSVPDGADGLVHNGAGSAPGGTDGVVGPQTDASDSLVSDPLNSLLFDTRIGSSDSSRDYVKINSFTLATQSTTSVAEPGTLTFFGLVALAGLGYMVRRRLAGRRE